MCCLVPGPIENLRFIKISSSVLQVMWNSPRVTNGVIQSYLVQVERYDGLIFSNSFQGQQTSALVPNLCKQTIIVSFIIILLTSCEQKTCLKFIAQWCKKKGRGLEPPNNFRVQSKRDNFSHEHLKLQITCPWRVSLPLPTPF